MYVTNFTDLTVTHIIIIIIIIKLYLSLKIL